MVSGFRTGVDGSARGSQRASVRGGSPQVVGAAGKVLARGSQQTQTPASGGLVASPALAENPRLSHDVIENEWGYSQSDKMVFTASV